MITARFAWIALAASLVTASACWAQPSCGDPPRVDDQTLKGDLEGKARFLSSLIGDANLKGQVEAARTDTFSKYPNAGAARSDAYLLYMFCVFVMTDPKPTPDEKFHKIQEMRQTLNPAAPASAVTPGATTTGAQSPINQHTGNVTIQYGSSPPHAPPSDSR